MNEVNYRGNLCNNRAAERMKVIHPPTKNRITKKFLWILFRFQTISAALPTKECVPWQRLLILTVCSPLMYLFVVESITATMVSIVC